MEHLRSARAMESEPIDRTGRMGVALVTGGRRGIGRAIAIALADAGFDIAVLDREEDDDARTTVQAITERGARTVFHAADIGDVESHARIVERVQSDLGTIRCLVNNAGIQVPERKDLLDFEPAVFDSLIRVNLRGTFFLTQTVARHMLDHPDGAHRSIITITSANANLVSPEKGPYCISKAGLSMAIGQYALRLARDGIGVYEVRPGLIATPMTEDVRARYDADISSGRICPEARWGQPEDIAGAVMALASGAMPFSTGDVFNVGGGMHIPRL